jgi:hypothetical protein
LKTNISLILSLFVLLLGVETTVASTDISVKGTVTLEQQSDTSDRATLDHDPDFDLISSKPFVPAVNWLAYSLHFIPLAVFQRYYYQPPIRAPPSSSFPLI